MRRAPCSNRRSRSTRTTPTRWRAKLTLMQMSIPWWRNPEADYDAKILGPADRAIALAPDTLWAYYVKSFYLYYSHRADKAIDAADAGLAINPNFGGSGECEATPIFCRPFRTGKIRSLQAMRLVRAIL